jgi:hypothetical protein
MSKPFRANSGFVEQLKESMKDSMHSAISEVWDEVVTQLKRDMYCLFRGYTHAEFHIVEGCSGQDWWDCKLSDLVTEFLRDRDGSDEGECEWCDAIAADMEKQATRIRRHADKIRTK